MAVTITNISIDELPGIERQYGDGLIIQDCDLNPYEAANVVNETFTHGGILLERTEFQKVMVFQNDGRTNLLFPFFQVKLEMGKLVMWQFFTYKTCHSVFLRDHNRGKRSILGEKCNNIPRPTRN